MDPLDAFAAEAERYVAWVRAGEGEGAETAREAMRLLLRLVLAAMELPPPWTRGLPDGPEEPRIASQERQTVEKRLPRLPLDSYATVFHAITFPPEKPSVGSLRDDLADVWAELEAGLRAFRSGRRAQANWIWGFGFRHHWGYHATQAVDALRGWLQTHDPTRLTNG